MQRLRVLKYRVGRRPDVWWSVTGSMQFGDAARRYRYPALWRVGNYQQ